MYFLLKFRFHDVLTNRLLIRLFSVHFYIPYVSLFFFFLCVFSRVCLNKTDPKLIKTKIILMPQEHRLENHFGNCPTDDSIRNTILPSQNRFPWHKFEIN